MEYEMDTVVTGVQVSFRHFGDPIHKRLSNCQILKYFDVGVMYGIQGDDFFKAIKEHIDDLEFNVLCGYVWERHVPLYERMGLKVTVLREQEFEGRTVKFVWVERK